MKTLLRIVLATLLLTGTLSTVSLADGPTGACPTGQVCPPPPGLAR